MSCCGGGSEPESIIDRQRIVKIVVLGNSSVGKTTLINTLVARKDPLTPYSALELTSAYVNTKFNGVECNIWDTAGQERFRSLATSYLRASNICIICYSLNDEKSYTDISVWEDIIDGCSPGAKKIYVATMLDIAMLTVKEGGIVPDVEVSSILGDGIQDLRDLLGRTAGQVSGQHVL